MISLKQAATVLTLSAVSLNASGNSCAPYLGEVITPTPFNNIAAKLKKINHIKSEFETTKHFDKRIADARKQLKTSYIVQSSINMNAVKYDADSKRLAVFWYSFDSDNLSYGQKLDEYIPRTVTISSWGGHIDIMLSGKVEAQGSYTGQNAFGAVLKVETETRRYQSIYDKVSTGYGGLFYQGSKVPIDNTVPLHTFNNVEPMKAKTFKETAKSFVVIEPKWPFYVAETDLTKALRFESTAIVENIFADIKCLLVTDANNKVFLALQTGK